MSEVIVSVRTSPDQPCWNAEALDAYAQDNPKVGVIACSGCVPNPVVGNICSATADGEPICGTGQTALSSGEALTAVQVPGFRLTKPSVDIAA